MNSTGQYKDKILKIVLENCNNWNYAITLSTMLNNELTEDEINHLIEEIQSFHIKVADIRQNSQGTYLLKPNQTTEKFLSSGGFYKIEKIDNEKKDKVSQKEELEFKISKWKYNTFWLVFAFGLFGGLYSLIDIAKTFFKDENSTIKKEVQQIQEKDSIKMEVLKHEIDSLKIQLNKLSKRK